MVLADSNFWLALALSGHRHHQVARGWFDSLDGPGEVVFCRFVQQSFLRLLTTGAVLAPYGNPPLDNRAAWASYQALQADERVGFVHEPPGLEAIWHRLACRGTASPKLWMDAYLAAISIAGSYRFVTTDKAFRQHVELDVILLRADPDAGGREKEG